MTDPRSSDRATRFDGKTNTQMAPWSIYGSTIRPSGRRGQRETEEHGLMNSTKNKGPTEELAA